MKICLISDQHFGARGNSPFFFNYFERFYKEIFFPYLDQHPEIQTLLDLGDTFEVRKQIEFQTLYRAKKIYFDEINKRKLDVHCLVGNHNAYFKHSNEVNSLDLLLHEYGFYIYKEPQEVAFDNLKILLVPWINDENQELSHKAIAKTNAPVLLGHLEVKGFKINRGVEAKFGFEKNDLFKFELVGSGHFHWRSMVNNIYYFGSPYQMRWDDFGNERGFHIFDTETKNLEFVKNPLESYQLLEYDKGCIMKPVENRIVQIIVKNIDDQLAFDKFIDQVERESPHSLEIVDRREYVITDTEIDDSVEDTKTIILKHIDSIDDAKINIKQVKEVISDLYVEALSLV